MAMFAYRALIMFAVVCAGSSGRAGRSCIAGGAAISQQSLPTGRLPASAGGVGQS